MSRGTSPAELSQYDPDDPQSAETALSAEERASIDERHVQTQLCRATVPGFVAPCGFERRHPIHDTYPDVAKRDQLDDESRRHEFADPTPGGQCEEDRDTWPCDARRLLDAALPASTESTGAEYKPTHTRGEPPPIDLDGIEMRFASQWGESDDGQKRAWRDDIAALIDEVHRLRRVSNGYFEEMVRRGGAAPGGAPAALDAPTLAAALRRYADGRARLVLPVSRLDEIARAVARLARSASEPEGSADLVEDAIATARLAVSSSPCNQDHAKDIEYAFRGTFAEDVRRASSSEPEAPGLPPIYCTGGCDACRAYARELGVPLIISPPPPGAAGQPAGTTNP